MPIGISVSAFQTHYSRRMKKYFSLILVFALIAILTGCSLPQRTATQTPRIDYEGSFGNFLVCDDLRTAFTCDGSTCKNGKTVYQLAMSDETWKQFEAALRTDRANAPIASIVEPDTGTPPLERSSSLSYVLDGRSYEGTAENYDAFSVRLSGFFDETISARTATASEDFSVFENNALCAR